MTQLSLVLADIILQMFVCILSAISLSKIAFSALTLLAG